MTVVKWLRYFRLYTLIAIMSSISFSSKAETLIVASGPGAVNEIINPLQDEFEKNSGIKIQLLDGQGIGAASIMMAVDKNSAEVGLTGGDWDLLVKLPEKTGYKYQSLKDMKNKEIGYQTLYMVANKNIGPDTLTKEQIKKILNGEITNWKELGLADSPVLVVAGTRIPAMNQLLYDRTNDGQNPKKTPKFLNTVEDLGSYVESTPGSITFGPVALLKFKVKQVKTDEIKRPMTVIAKNFETPKIKKFVEAITIHYKKVTEPK